MQEEITKHPDSGVSCGVEIQTKQHGEKTVYLFTSDISVATRSRDKVLKQNVTFSEMRSVWESVSLSFLLKERFNALPFTS